jgi:hypothetical protein
MTDMLTTTLDELAIDAPETNLEVVDTPAEVAPAKRTLNFTVVHGYLRGEHRCPFELHATGCRDLNKLKRLKMYSFEVLAATREDAHTEAASELGVAPTDIWVQPCCTLKRMQAIGRA